MAGFDDMVLVGRVARPHGLKGHVVVNPETDFVEARFAPGARLWARSAAGEEQVTVASVRGQGTRPVVAFVGFDRIDDAERLTGAELRVPEETLQPLAPGAYYEHQLIGCEIVTADGGSIGHVARVEGGGGSTRLVVDGGHGEVQVPFAQDICREVDPVARRIVIVPPEGLLELNAAGGPWPPPGDERK